MIAYSSTSGKSSGVMAYEIGDDYIIVQFTSFEKYKYTYASAGRNAIETMKQCAARQNGLSSYISQNRPRYSLKF